MVALVMATCLKAAGHHEGRYVQSSCRHELTWHCLVARSQANHAVHLRAFDGHFDVIRDEVACCQHISTARTGTGDEIAGGSSSDFHWYCPRIADGLLEDLGNLIKVAVTACQFAAGVDHRDLGFFAVVFRQAHGHPLRVANRPEIRAPGKVAAQLAWGTHEFRPLVIVTVPVSASTRTQSPV